MIRTLFPFAAAAVFASTLTAAPQPAGAETVYNYQQPAPLSRKEMRDARRKLRADSGRIGPFHPICLTPVIGNSLCLGIIKPDHVSVSLFGD